MKNQRLSRERMREIKMFDVKTEKVEITNGDKKDVYNIGPLSGEYLEDLYYVMDAFKGDKPELAENASEAEKSKREADENTRVLKVLGTDVSKKLHRLVFASLAQSYPTQDKTALNQFVSQNLMSFIGAIITANVPKSE